MLSIFPRKHFFLLNITYFSKYPTEGLEPGALGLRSIARFSPKTCFRILKGSAVRLQTRNLHQRKPNKTKPKKSSNEAGLQWPFFPCFIVKIRDFGFPGLSAGARACARGCACVGELLDPKMAIFPLLCSENRVTP